MILKNLYIHIYLKLVKLEIMQNLMHQCIWDLHLNGKEIKKNILNNHSNSSNMN